MKKTSLKRFKLSLLTLTAALLQASCLQAKILVDQETRTTEKGFPVQVIRYQYSSEEKTVCKLVDRRYQEIYAEPNFQLVFRGDLYDYARNCHDYAFGPYMSCCPGGQFISQKEAWDLQDPRWNWADGSMVNVVASVFAPQAVGEDYTFYTADLSPLPSLYYDVTVQMVPLPTCPMDTLDQNPVHSAILINWFTLPGTMSDYSAGIFISKWGDWGIYQHRWGPAFLPDIYCNTSTLRIFAPRPGWQPPYFVFHTPWG